MPYTEEHGVGTSPLDEIHEDYSHATNSFADWLASKFKKGSPVPRRQGDTVVYDDGRTKVTVRTDIKKPSTKFSNLKGAIDAKSTEISETGGRAKRETKHIGWRQGPGRK